VLIGLASAFMDLSALIEAGNEAEEAGVILPCPVSESGTRAALTLAVIASPAPA
jgi:hypothetical protein